MVRISSLLSFFIAVKLSENICFCHAFNLWEPNKNGESNSDDLGQRAQFTGGGPSLQNNNYCIDDHSTNLIDNDLEFFDAEETNNDNQLDGESEDITGAISEPDKASSNPKINNGNRSRISFSQSFKNNVGRTKASTVTLDKSTEDINRQPEGETEDTTEDQTEDQTEDSCTAEPISENNDNQSKISSYFQWIKIFFGNHKASTAMADETIEAVANSFGAQFVSSLEFTENLDEESEDRNVDEANDTSTDNVNYSNVANARQWWHQKERESRSQVTSQAGQDNLDNFEEATQLKAPISPSKAKVMSDGKFSEADHKGITHDASYGYKKQDEKVSSDVLKNNAKWFRITSGQYAMISNGTDEVKRRISIARVDFREKDDNPLIVVKVKSNIKRDLVLGITGSIVALGIVAAIICYIFW